MAPVTRALLLLNGLIFVLETVAGEGLIKVFALWPLALGFQPWQLLSSAFLHAGIAHLAMNMFGLWMFGRDVERALGSPRFLQLYLLSALTASIAQLAVTAMLDQRVPTLGASGAVFGVLGAFALLYPNRIIVLLIPPIPLPSRVFVALYAAIELFAGVYGTEAGVAHFAHLGGLLGGLLLVRHWRRRWH
jgi:membrane associated rhomboid family serine protease